MFWTKAKYGKMSTEGRDPVNTETPHYGEAGAVDEGKILVMPRNTNIPGNSRSAKVTASIRAIPLLRPSQNPSAALRSSLW